MLTCKETQWTHLVLDIHYTHACVGRPIKPFFAPLELCYCLYHFFSLQMNHFSPFDTKPVQIWLICWNWEVCSLPSALQLTYNLSGSYPWLAWSSDHKHKGRELGRYKSRTGSTWTASLGRINSDRLRPTRIE